MGSTRILGENSQKKSKGHYSQTIKGEQLFLKATHCLDLIYIPLKFHEDIPNSYKVMWFTIMKITQNKHKTIIEP